ncbi:MAG: phosphoheptose isomerase, partial [Caproiciproducens sp.]|nr:phosphoheptose isomerase [Caproiciproducens sp.]
ALSTATGNDVDPLMAYAQLVFAMGKTGDVLLCISTSGNAGNVFQAALTAKATGLRVIGLTGETGGKLAGICDACVKVPETETFKVQELHLPVYHCLCSALEQDLYGDRL